MSLILLRESSLTMKILIRAINLLDYVAVRIVKKAVSNLK